MPTAPISPTTTSPSRESTQTWQRSLYELLSSMRFAIVLLTVISIASIIGTVLRQHEPLVNYVDAFGPFWADLFLTLQLNVVYSAWWFLLILGFLVVSTSLCIARNAPKYLADMQRFKEDIRASSFRAMPFKAEAVIADLPADNARAMSQVLGHAGWKVRLQERAASTKASAGWMVAAKRGAGNKIGYIATHSAIVLICLGGLIDGDLLVRAQIWLGQKAPFTGTGMLADVPSQHRLSADNPSFRGNILVNEGTRSGTALLNTGNGILLQELPFLIELHKFDVEYYSTGMPRVFASDVSIIDRATGQSSEHRIEVNHPLRVDGIDIFQSSFDDGGSEVVLQPIGLLKAIEAPEITGTIGGQTTWPSAADRAEPPNETVNATPTQTLEFAELRVLNVENLSEASRAGSPSSSAVDVRKVDLRSSIEARLGAGNKTSQPHDLRNIGPSITYRLRDAAGQATEFHNYMLAVDLGDGVPVYLLGMRRQLSEAFSYLRLPQDAEGHMQSFLGLLQALQNPQLRAAAAKRYAAHAVDHNRPDMQAQLEQSALRTVDLFAGAIPLTSNTEADTATSTANNTAGLIALSRFMEQNVPAAELERATEVLLRILNGVLFELLQSSREAAGLPALDGADPATQNFMRVALFSLNDAYFYPEPVFFMLDDFKQIQASVFQVAKAPGRYIVYTGCLFLIIGIFMMLYVRERRLWIWLSEAAPSTASTTSESEAPAHSPATTQAQMALSTNRRTLDTQREFALLQARLLPAVRSEHPLDGDPR